jgi:hypothetical protein
MLFNFKRLWRKKVLLMYSRNLLKILNLYCDLDR